MGKVTLDLVHYVWMYKAQHFSGHFSLTAQAKTLNAVVPFTTVLATPASFIFPLPYFFFPKTLSTQLFPLQHNEEGQR